MTRCAFAKAFCADRSRFMRCCVAGFMPEDLPNSSREVWSVIDAVRAVVRTRPAGSPGPRRVPRRQREEIRGRRWRWLHGGPAPPRGTPRAGRCPRPPRSASFSAATARRRFFSFFRSFFRRFRFFFLALALPLLLLLPRRLRAVLAAGTAGAGAGAGAATTARRRHPRRETGHRCSARRARRAAVRAVQRCTAALAACGAVRAGLVRSMRCQRTAARELWLL